MSFPGGAGAGMLTFFAAATRENKAAMYGIIGKMSASDGQRDELISILLSGTKDMPGCHCRSLATNLSFQRRMDYFESAAHAEPHSYINCTASTGA